MTYDQIYEIIHLMRLGHKNFLDFKTAVVKYLEETCNLNHCQATICFEEAERMNKTFELTFHKAYQFGVLAERIIKSIGDKNS